MKSARFRLWLILAVFVVILDQITKYWISHHFDYAVIHPVTSFFNLVWINNKGTAWGMLQNQPGWQRIFLSAVAIIVSIYILVCFIRSEKMEPVFACAMSLILGGAIGNLIDRIYSGSVVDFIQLHAYGYYFAVFNIADVAVTIGAILLIGTLLFKK